MSINTLRINKYNNDYEKDIITKQKLYVTLPSQGVARGQRGDCNPITIFLKAIQILSTLTDKYLQIGYLSLSPDGIALKFAISESRCQDVP